MEAVRRVIVGESETVTGEDALGRYFAREFREKGETLRLSRVLTRIEGGGGEGG